MMNLSEFCYFRCTGTYTLRVVSDGDPIGVFTRSLALKVRETELADSISVSSKECNERKGSILIEKTLLSHHSFKSVLVSHTFGDMTLALRETVFYSFSVNVRFESETSGFRENVIKYR